MDLSPLKIERGETAAPARRRRRGKWVARIVVVLVVAAIVYTFWRPLKDVVDRWRLPTVSVVEAYEASPLARTAVSGTSANGYIVARVRAALSADTPGRIVELNVQEGSVVQKGDVVARLYSEEHAAALAAANAELAQAQAGAARARAEAETAREAVDVQEAGVVAAEARLAASESDLELARRELARVEDLHAAGFSTEQALDQARTDLERTGRLREAEAAAAERAREEVLQAKSALAAAGASAVEAAARIPVAEALRDQAAATLAKTYVRAPFDGIVVLKDAEVGEVVSPNSLGGNSRGSVATMVDFSTLEAQVELSETSIGSVRMGDAAAIFLDAFENRRYEGRVDRIWPTANRQKGTIEVRVVFLEPDAYLKPEMGVRVVFSPPPLEEGAGEDADAGMIVLPASAIVREGEREYVFVVERGVARARDVAITREANGRAMLSSGVAVGDKVVNEPPPDLDDGDRVRIQG